MVGEGVTGGSVTLRLYPYMVVWCIGVGCSYLTLGESSGLRGISSCGLWIIRCPESDMFVSSAASLLRAP